MPTSATWGAPPVRTSSLRIPSHGILPLHRLVSAEGTAQAAYRIVIEMQHRGRSTRKVDGLLLMLPFPACKLCWRYRVDALAQTHVSISYAYTRQAQLMGQVMSSDGSSASPCLMWR